MLENIKARYAKAYEEWLTYSKKCVKGISICIKCDELLNELDLLEKILIEDCSMTCEELQCVREPVLDKFYKI